MSSQSAPDAPHHSAPHDHDSGEPVLIKKYANRRLYNTETSAYVTLDDLCQIIVEGRDFIVRDAKSAEDLTRQVLAQIIVEQESQGHNLLPARFLKRIIGMYGHNLREYVPHYLEASMDQFLRQQEQLNAMMQQAVGTGMLPLSQMQEMTQRNMQMFRQAWQQAAQTAMKQMMDNTVGVFNQSLGAAMDAFTPPTDRSKR